MTTTTRLHAALSGLLATIAALSAGEVPTEERQPPFPNGASGWNNLFVTVTDAT